MVKRLFIQSMFVLENIQILFKRYPSVLVFIVLVEEYELIDAVHCLACGVGQRLIVEQMTNENGRKDVACAGKMHRDFIIAELEILIADMVVAHDRGLPVDRNACNEHRLCANLAQKVKHMISFFQADAFTIIRAVSQVAGLGEVGIA